MEESKATPLAVVLAAMLHLGLAAFLLLATLPCATWERAIANLGLPDSWNPVTCSKPVTLPGPVIEATLVGPTAAPAPVAAKKAREAKPVPPPPAPSPPSAPKPTPKPPPVKTLPPPPERPDVKDQQKVVQQAQQKAEQAKRAQEEREKQRMAELQAEQEQQARIDKLFTQLDQAKRAANRAEHRANLESQRQAQISDLKKQQGADTPARAEQAQSGTGGKDDSLLARYQASIQSAVTQAWLRPDNIPPGVVCNIDIVQIPGGQVISAKVESGCPYDEAGRRSVENAVMRAQPLPYQGFEKVFQRQITLHFKVDH